MIDNILQIAVDELDPMVLRSLEMLSGHYPNANHIFLAEALRQGNPIFTTNVGTVRSRPITMNVAPVSPIECVNERMIPAIIPLFIKGKDTVSIASKAEAPSVRAESSYMGIFDPS